MEERKEEKKRGREGEKGGRGRGSTCIHMSKYGYMLLLLWVCFSSLQEVQLDKHIKLLDSPGVVIAKGSMDDPALALRNCIKVCCFAKL